MTQTNLEETSTGPALSHHKEQLYLARRDLRLNLALEQPKQVLTNNLYSHDHNLRPQSTTMTIRSTHAYPPVPNRTQIP